MDKIVRTIEFTEEDLIVLSFWLGYALGVETDDEEQELLRKLIVKVAGEDV